jgi:hypothetical protein
MGLLILLGVGCIFWGYVALAITVDQKIRTARARARDEVNFDDGSPGKYIFWGLFTGGFILPVYFYATRKQRWAVALGAGVYVVVLYATALTVGALTLGVAAVMR